MFDLNYFSSKSIDDFELKYRNALSEHKSSVIEIFTNLDEIPQKLNSIHKKIIKNTL